MTITQLTSRKNLRDLMDNSRVQKIRMYHLGMKPSSRAAQARVNTQPSYELYQKTDFQLLSQYQVYEAGNNVKFKGKSYLLDITTVKPYLFVFLWVKYRKTKGAITLHFGLDADGHLPVFMDMTDGKKHAIEWAGSLKISAG